MQWLVKFLGHLVSSNGIAIDPDKTEKVRSLKKDPELTAAIILNLPCSLIAIYIVSHNVVTFKPITLFPDG